MYIACRTLATRQAPYSGARMRVSPSLTVPRCGVKLKLTQKQEKFVLNLFSGMNQTKAYMEAGYSCRKLTTITANASRLAITANVLQRLNELKAKAESDKIMSVTERRERLSEIARARLTDYQESGQDGGWINIGKESPNTAALSEIVSTTKYDENGANPTLITRIRLHNPVNAIQELNKMDRVYDDSPKILNLTQNIYNLSSLTDEELHALERIVAKAAPLIGPGQGGDCP